MPARRRPQKYDGQARRLRAPTDAVVNNGRGRAGGADGWGAGVIFHMSEVVEQMLEETRSAREGPCIVQLFRASHPRTVASSRRSTTYRLPIMK